MIFAHGTDGAGSRRDDDVRREEDRIYPVLVRGARRLEAVHSRCTKYRLQNSRTVLFIDY